MVDDLGISRTASKYEYITILMAKRLADKRNELRRCLKKDRNLKYI